MPTLSGSTTCAEGGGTLCEILKAGQWASPAFTSYLDMETVERAGALEAHLDESEDEDEARLEQRPVLPMERDSSAPFD
jgi:hypothetical protein